MIASGTVNTRREAVVRLRGPGGDEADIDAVIDTGYTGGAHFAGDGVHGSRASAEGGRDDRAGGRGDAAGPLLRRQNPLGPGWMPVAASAVGTDALVGMLLLEGCRLEIDVTAGGAVAVRAIVPPAI